MKIKSQRATRGGRVAGNIFRLIIASGLGAALVVGGQRAVEKAKASRQPATPETEPATEPEATVKTN